jgi:hypothetical protein
MRDLKATIPPATHLVTIDFVRALRGTSAEAVQAAVEAGQYRFVWNLGRREIGELRFWIGEIISPQLRTLPFQEVVAQILGEQRKVWRGAEVAQMLLVSRPTLHRLCQAGLITGKISDHTLMVPRQALESLLKIRWLGGALNVLRGTKCPTPSALNPRSFRWKSRRSH